MRPGRLTIGVLIAALVGVVVTVACGRLQLRSADKGRQMDAALKAQLKAPRKPAYVTSDAEGTRLWKQTREFYEKRTFQPAWIENGAPGGQMQDLVNAIKQSHDDGLNPELYNVAHLEQRLAEASKGFLTKKGFDPKEAGAMDVWLTYLYMKHASDLADGLSDLARADPAWNIKPEKFNPLQHLETALQNDRIAESLQELTPDTPHYVALREALAEHREIASKGGWPTVPRALKLKPGQRSPAVAGLAKRLAASGDYEGPVPADGEPAVYGAALQEAVKRFQRRHGLQDDGAVGPALVAAMNVPVDQRIRQLELNLERWRWLPRELGERHILVNIPEMRLEVRERNRVPLTMRVVVGKQDTQTPIFNDMMTHLVFSPYWNVPDSIAQGETLPSLMNDPDFLERNNMEIVDASGNTVDPSTADLSDPTKYRFRQRPGKDNSLGLVKFMFPNQFSVYLHDTPADSLFARASRSFSHGCVRVEDPVKLAEYVLGDQPEWTREKIAEAMHAGEERTVKLRKAIPVYLGYWTANVSPDGLVQFRNDVYGIDGRQTAMLAARLKRLRSSTAAATAAVTTPASGNNAQ
jgi:murein L,D-transpeptidase YcbB/YkuD